MQLKFIHLTIYWAIESRDTTETYAKDFIKRMAANRPQKLQSIEVRLEPLPSNKEEKWRNPHAAVTT